MRALVADPDAGAFTVRLTDEVPRIRDRRQAARRFGELVESADLTALPRVDRLALRVGAVAARLAPTAVVPLVVRRLRGEASGVILPDADPGLADHLRDRRAAGMRCNVNVLGEAIIGDDEAAQRLDRVIAKLGRPDVHYVSVKISAVCAGVSALAFESTVDRVADRLRVLYRAAASFDPPKFVNLDMEEYRDLALTIAAFECVLDEPEFGGLDAGIVIQAYLPDTQAVAHRIGEWAVARRRRHGGTTKVRIVKGANLAMEAVEAELHGWESATYDTKADVDANYKAILDVLLEPAFDDVVRVGVASHNLFDIAWALTLRSELVDAGRPARIEIEMLEGMADAQAEAVRSVAGDLLLYTPVVADDDFAAAIAYLTRRLDENTAPENFLAHVFDLADDPAEFDRQAARFRAAVRSRHRVDQRQRRGVSLRRLTTTISEPFHNAADTDWTAKAERDEVLVSIAATGSSGIDQANEPTIDVAAVDTAIATATDAARRWAGLRAAERAEILNIVGDLIDGHRHHLIATMAHDAGKTIAEGDPEVSEAADFARYYARQALHLEQVPGARAVPLGVVTVAPPWNFPLAIPAGGVLAALAAGNAVILKPAPQSVATARALAELCWRGGVPDDVLQFLPAADDDAGRRLITHPGIGAVVLTGAFETAAMFHEWRPEVRLHAETSGKNAIVVTAAADLDRALADVARSAFGHAGQKCSAASLLILTRPLADDPAVLARLRDAAATLRVGLADDPSTDVGPLIAPPSGNLLRALTELEPGERWLLEPKCRSADRRLWSPGIRTGVRAGSWFARTECFGPVLGVIAASDLDEAITIQNDTAYGLTAGLQSLDPDEVTEWSEGVEAGNLYVNRGITGAVVQRQPFGGWKRSAVGPTAKAGGPNYVATLCRWLDTGLPVAEIAEQFERWMVTVGRAESDVTGLASERNVFRYRPLAGGVLVRFGTDVDERQRLLVRAAATATGTRLLTSDAATEPVQALADRLAATGVDRLRLLGADRATDDLRIAAHRAGIAVDDTQPVGAPEIELPRWLREQSVTITNHRHGRITPLLAPTPDDVRDTLADRSTRRRRVL